MLKFTVKVNRARLNAIVRKTGERKIRSILSKIADRIRLLMRLPKTGRRYGSHTASAPGEAPAIRTGRLIGSIGEPVVKGLRGSLTISAPYAGFLERGTERMAARPFAEVATDGVLSELRRQGSTIGRL